MSAAPFLSVVVPALNEEGCIASFIERMRNELSRLVPSWEILVVDDGSRDRTAAIVTEEAGRDPRVRLITGPHQGKGAAVRQGLLAATGEWRFMADADLAMPPDNLARFLAAIEGPNPPQVVIGSREAPGSERIGESTARHVIGRVFNWTVRLCALPGIHDTQCGFKLFSRAAVERVLPRLTVAGFAMDVELLFLARRAGLNVREVGIIWRGRADSRVAVGRGAEAFLDILRMRWRNRSDSRAWAVALAASATALFTLAWRYLTFSGFSNDHYVHLARAQQMLLGEWPVRDFVDPGLPLMYGASAVARLVGGRALGTELALVSGALALGAALMVVAATRLSGSVLTAIFVSVLGVLMNPRSYGYPKVLLYAVLAAMVCRASADVPLRRILALALFTAVSFLFRHDHGLFVGLGGAVFIAMQSASSGSPAIFRRVGLFAAMVGLLLAPWAVLVSASAGLVPYFESAIAFSREEARANVLRELPRMDWASGVATASNGVAFLFYLFHALPLLCLALILWRRRRGHDAWPGETSAVVALSVMAIPLNLSFLRDSLPARMPDAFVPAGLLGAWLLGPAFSGAWGRARVAGAVVALGMAAVSARAVVLAAQVPEQLDRTELFTENGEVSERVAELRQRLARAVPEGDQVPSRHAAALMPFMAFLQRCTARSDRLLVTSLRPEIYVIANRGFAGGHVGFSPGFYGSEAEQALILARLRRQSVPFVVRLLDVDEELAETMPRVIGYLNQHYTPLADIEVSETPGVRVYLERGRSAVSTDQQTGWPCLPTKHPR